MRSQYVHGWQMLYDIPDGLIAAEKSVYLGAPVVVGPHRCQSCAQNIKNEILQPPSSETLRELTVVASNPVAPVNRQQNPPRTHPPLFRYFNYGLIYDKKKTIPPLKSSMKIADWLLLGQPASVRILTGDVESNPIAEKIAIIPQFFRRSLTKISARGMTRCR